MAPTHSSRQQVLSDLLSVRARMGEGEQTSTEINLPAGKRPCSDRTTYERSTNAPPISKTSQPPSPLPKAWNSTMSSSPKHLFNSPISPSFGTSLVPAKAEPTRFAHTRHTWAMGSSSTSTASSAPRDLSAFSASASDLSPPTPPGNYGITESVEDDVIPPRIFDRSQLTVYSTLLGRRAQRILHGSRKRMKLRFARHWLYQTKQM